MENNKKLKFWWIPQIPGKAFEMDIKTLEEGALLMTAFANYDIFQYENNIKPDFCNAGGVQQFDEEEGEWFDWYDEESGEDDLEVYLESLN